MDAVNAVNRHLLAGLQGHLAEDLRYLELGFEEEEEQQFATLAGIVSAQEESTSLVLKRHEVHVAALTRVKSSCFDYSRAGCAVVGDSEEQMSSESRCTVVAILVGRKPMNSETSSGVGHLTLAEDVKEGARLLRGPACKGTELIFNRSVNFCHARNLVDPDPHREEAYPRTLPPLAAARGPRCRG